MQYWDQLRANAHSTISRQEHFGQGKVNDNAKLMVIALNFQEVRINIIVAIIDCGGHQET
jgi:hypothetical protein